MDLYYAGMADPEVKFKLALPAVPRPGAKPAWLALGLLLCVGIAGIGYAVWLGANPEIPVGPEERRAENIAIIGFLGFCVLLGAIPLYALCHRRDAWRRGAISLARLTFVDAGPDSDHSDAMASVALAPLSVFLPALDLILLSRQRKFPVLAEGVVDGRIVTQRLRTSQMPAGPRVVWGVVITAPLWPRVSWLPLDLHPEAYTVVAEPSIAALDAEIQAIRGVVKGRGTPTKSTPKPAKVVAPTARKGNQRHRN